MRSAVLVSVSVILVAVGACGDSFLDGKNGSNDPGAGGTGDIDLGDPQTEVCNNGLNEDGDADVDENCVCDIGQMQDCFPGAPNQAGVGICSFGTQVCYPIGANEVETYGQWGPCQDAVLPQTEQCGDGLDSDCNGRTDCDECDSGGPCPPPSSGSGDYNTSGAGSGDENTSGGSGDNNTTSGSGSGDYNTGSGASSGSGDNNTSGSGASSTSSGGGDGCVCKPGTIRWCDTPVGCLWGKQVCAPDGDWGSCIETTSRPAGCEDFDFYDPGCCIVAPNACCQNPFTDESMGDCTQQLDCY